MQHILLNTELWTKIKNEHPTSNIQRPTSNDCTPSVFQFYNLMERRGILIRRSMLSVQCSMFKLLHLKLRTSFHNTSKYVNRSGVLNLVNYKRNIETFANLHSPAGGNREKSLSSIWSGKRVLNFSIFEFFLNMTFR